MKLPTLRSVKNLKNKKVLVRLDFNVPLRNGEVRDDYRIQKSLPTLHFLQKAKAKIILFRFVQEYLYPLGHDKYREQNEHDARRAYGIKRELAV